MNIEISSIRLARPKPLQDASRARAAHRGVDVVWKAATVGPGLVISALPVLLAGRMLADWAGALACMVGVVVVLILMLGGGEPCAVRLVFRARRLTCAQQDDLRDVITGLCKIGLGPPIIDLYISRRTAALTATARGRRSVIVTDALVTATTSGRIPNDEVVAAIAHACLVARSGMSRQDPVIALCGLPCLMLRNIGRPVGGIVGFSWRVRPVVVGVAIWQGITTGPGAGSPMGGDGTAAALAALLVMSYATPYLTRRWAVHVTRTADALLADFGLGPSMATFLYKFPRTRSSIERIRFLEAPSG
ncbi:MAG: hypothetical protein H7288_12480 [Kineosporiaceae bacterium]|nr:hypothetical protein [Aeromicrobium sp.]